VLRVEPARLHPDGVRVRVEAADASPCRRQGEG